MIKTFTINSISHQQETPESGLIIWQMLDERSRTRRVKGCTELGRQGFIRNVQPSNDREMPLVEALTRHGEGETFEIDFTLFNQTFGHQPREVYPEPQPTAPASSGLKGYLRRLLGKPFGERPRS